VQATALASVLANLALWILGPFVYEHWVRKEVAFNPLCFHLLLGVSVASALWTANSVIAMSANRHHGIAGAFLLVTILCLGAGSLLLPILGIPGAAGSILAGEAALTCVGLRMALHHLHEPLAEFIREVFWIKFAPAPSAVREGVLD
jgi:hypothetical protein